MQIGDQKEDKSKLDKKNEQHRPSVIIYRMRYLAMTVVHHLGFPDISSVAAKRCLFGERREKYEACGGMQN